MHAQLCSRTCSCTPLMAPAPGRVHLCAAPPTAHQQQAKDVVEGQRAGGARLTHRGHAKQAALCACSRHRGSELNRQHNNVLAFKMRLDAMQAGCLLLTKNRR